MNIVKELNRLNEEFKFQPRRVDERKLVQDLREEKKLDQIIKEFLQFRFFYDVTKVRSTAALLMPNPEYATLIDELDFDYPCNNKIFLEKYGFTYCFRAFRYKTEYNEPIKALKLVIDTKRCERFPVNEEFKLLGVNQELDYDIIPEISLKQGLREVSIQDFIKF